MARKRRTIRRAARATRTQEDVLLGRECDADGKDASPLEHTPNAPTVETSPAASMDETMSVEAGESDATADDTLENNVKPKKPERNSLKELKAQALNDFNAELEKQRVQRLHFLLEKSTHYSEFLANKMRQQQEAARMKAAAQFASEATDDSATGKRKRRDTDAVGNTLASSDAEKQKRLKVSSQETSDQQQDRFGHSAPEEEMHVIDDGTLVSARQPKLVTGGVMREYQLRGLEWLISLYENGLSGILADEMGLGKTLQTIAFLAHLWTNGVCGPFLIVAPLSTLGNWVTEIRKFTPSLPVVLYHGTVEERDQIRRTKLKQKNSKLPIVVTSYEIVMNDRKHLGGYHWKYIVVDEGHRIKNVNCKLLRELKGYSSANRLLLTGTPLQNNLTELWSLLNFLLPDIFDDVDAFQDWFDLSDLGEAAGAKRVLGEEASKSVVSNLHHILQPFLLRRLKCDVEVDLPKKREYLIFAPLTSKQKEIYQAILSKDIREFLIKKRLAGSRSTPSSRNLSVTNSIASPSTQTTSPASAVPTDAEDDLLSPGSPSVASSFERDTSPESIQEMERASPDIFQNHSDKHKTKSSARVPSLNDFRRITRSYSREISPLRYEVPDKNSRLEIPSPLPGQRNEDPEKKTAAKIVGGMRLQNIIMQLRKVCNHPLLFEQEYEIDEEITTSSGKMLLLDRMLPELLARDHRVLIFSQMTSMLDILEEWCVHLRDWPVFRIDGNVPQEERRRQMELFNNPRKECSQKEDVRIFLLSTRSGGLGINLTAADTVIIFDSDWNPQMDLQAQDRVHRIGQTRPVIVYRFVTANTVEAQILKKANSKRKLEKVVMHKGRFRGDRISQKSTGATASIAAELAEMLLAEEQEHINSKEQTSGTGSVSGSTNPYQVLNDEDLERLLDRSPQAYEAAEAALKGGETGQLGAVQSKAEAEGTSGAFSVFEQVSDETADALATKV